MRKLLCGLFICFICSCKEKADGYNTQQSSNADDSVVKGKFVPEPSTDYIFTTTEIGTDGTAMDTLYKSH